MKIDSKKPKHWLLLLQQLVLCVIAIIIRPIRKNPDKPLVILYGHQFSGNLQALYTEWSKSCVRQFDLFFLSLDPENAKQLRAAGLNVLQCNRLMDMLTLSQASALISDHGLHLMKPLVRFTDILFIDVWHGIPFKGFTPDDFRLQHRYDEVWVPSPLLKQIYQDKFGFRADIVHALGYARADRLFLRQPPDPLFRERASIPAGNKVVLYAPTWQQDDNGRELFPFGESQDSFIRQLSEVCRQHMATLVIRSHLNASISSMTLDNVRYCSMKDFPDAEGLLLHTDILICDWSSIAFDFLALNRPTLFLDVPPPFKNGFSLGGDYRFGKVVGDLCSLNKELKLCLDTPNDYFAEQGEKHQKTTFDAYGTYTDGQSAARQLNRLCKLLVD
jgi:CDP-glycerol glycerophosphotransferase (TagB/SpsB family)